MIAADTSVLVPAIVANHEFHEACHESASLVDASVTHVLVELYAVLTRLPQPFTVSPADAAAAVMSYADQPVAIPPGDIAAAIERFASDRIAGGRTYDALIAAAAASAGMTLLTRDHRAAETYELIGTDVRWVAT